MRHRIRALSRLEMPGDCRARRWTAKLVTGALRLKNPEDDPPVRSGRFAPLSSDSPNVHVCRAPTNAIDSPRVEDDEGLTGTRRRRRRLRPLPWSWDDTDSDGEQTHPTQADFVRSHRGRHVVPRRDGELPATIPRSLTPEEVPLHIVDALQEDLDPRHAPRFPCVCSEQI